MDFDNSLNRVGIDVGKKRIGISTAPKGTKIAFPYKIVELEKEEKKVSQNNIDLVFKDVEQFLPAVFYIGLPLNLSSKKTGSTNYALDWAKMFFEKLEKATKKILPEGQNIDKNLILGTQYNTIKKSLVFMVDERFSTVIAQHNFLEANVKAKDQKKIVDQEAARIILQTALDYEEKNGKYAGKNLENIL